MEKCKKCKHTWWPASEEIASYQCPECKKKNAPGPGEKKYLNKAMEELAEKNPEYRDNGVRRNHPKE